MQVQDASCSLQGPSEVPVPCGELHESGQALHLLDPVKLCHILPGLALKLVFDGAGWGGQLEGKRDVPRLGLHPQVLHKAAADNVLAKVGVYDARQLPQHLLLACIW